MFGSGRVVDASGGSGKETKEALLARARQDRERRQLESKALRSTSIIQVTPPPPSPKHLKTCFHDLASCLLCLFVWFGWGCDSAGGGVWALLRRCSRRCVSTGPTPSLPQPRYGHLAEYHSYHDLNSEAVCVSIWRICSRSSHSQRLELYALTRQLLFLHPRASPLVAAAQSSASRRPLFVPTSAARRAALQAQRLRDDKNLVTLCALFVQATRAEPSSADPNPLGSTNPFALALSAPMRSSKGIPLLCLLWFNFFASHYPLRGNQASSQCLNILGLLRRLCSLCLSLLTEFSAEPLSDERIGFSKVLALFLFTVTDPAKWTVAPLSPAPPSSPSPALPAAFTSLCSGLAADGYYSSAGNALRQFAALHASAAGQPIQSTYATLISSLAASMLRMLDFWLGLAVQPFSSSSSSSSSSSGGVDARHELEEATRGVLLETLCTPLVALTVSPQITQLLAAANMRVFIHLLSALQRGLMAGAPLLQEMQVRSLSSGDAPPPLAWLLGNILSLADSLHLSTLGAIPQLVSTQFIQMALWYRFSLTSCICCS